MFNDEPTSEEVRAAIGHTECEGCRDELCDNPSHEGLTSSCDRECAVHVGPDRLPFCRRCDAEVNGVEGEGVAA